MTITPCPFYEIDENQPNKALELQKEYPEEGIIRKDGGNGGYLK